MPTLRMAIKGVLRDMARSLWKAISNEPHFFSQFVHCIVGDRVDAYFWEDKAVGGYTPLLFVSLFLPFVCLEISL